MKHVTELDGLRAIAVLIVFVSHAGLGKWVPGGLGVTIFFFLSGYLITSLMRAEASAFGNVNIAKFYLRRALRIIPPLWIVLCLAYVITLAGILTAEIDLLALPSQFLFLINYAHLWGHVNGIPGIPLWSLAIEEHFYLLFPLTYSVFLSRMNHSQAAAWCLAACIVVLIVRIYTVFVMGEVFRTYYWSHTRIDSILFGCCLALWNNPIIDGKDAWKPNGLHFSLACVTIIFTLLVRSDLFRETLRYTLQGAALFAIFSYVLQQNNWTSSILNNVVAQKLGLYSYTIYLVHVPILIAVGQNLPNFGGLAKGSIGAFLSLVLAASMYVVIEKPLAEFRRRLRSASPSIT